MLAARTLTKTYRMGNEKIQALRKVDLEIKKGESVAVMGPSGSGKSTLLHMLGGLDKPSSGKVLVDGEDITDMTEDQLARMRSEKIGFVFQLHNLIPTLTALENVELPTIFSKAKKGKREKAIEILRSVGLGERLSHMPSQLSGGQQQRVAIARALANSPNIILADEPTGELDSESGREVLEIFHRLNKEQGLTLVVVTHDPCVAEYTERLVNVRDGRIFNGEQ